MCPYMAIVASHPHCSLVSELQLALSLRLSRNFFRCVVVDCCCSFAGWQPQGSAWKRYVAQATDAANPFRGFGAASPGQAQPAAPAAPEGPMGPAAAASSPVQSAPAGPFPVQLSLEKLQAERRSSLQQNPDGDSPTSTHLTPRSMSLAIYTCGWHQLSNEH